MLREIDMSLLHPLAWPAFVRLTKRVEADGRFHVFETWRHPKRQQELLELGRTKAAPWRSPHQYGLAVDYVPQVDGRWTWDVPTSWWDDLRKMAEQEGLYNNIPWDRAHVEHPAFQHRFSYFLKA